MSLRQDRTLEGRFLAQLYELANFVDDNTYKEYCDTALAMRTLRESNVPLKLKRKSMYIFKVWQATVLAKAKINKVREEGRELGLRYSTRIASSSFSSSAAEAAAAAAMKTIRELYHLSRSRSTTERLIGEWSSVVSA